MQLESKLRELVGNSAYKNNMIENNDKILIAFSGGKDSFTMLDILDKLKKKAPVNFELFPVMIDPGYRSDFSKIKKYITLKGYTLDIKKTKILDVVKKQMGQQKNTGNYCFMCSRMRRGILYKIAKESKCNKIALGHNLDDAIETFFMNIFYVSKLEKMKPTYVSEKGIRVIRPLLDVPESLIVEYTKENRFPLLKSKCLLRKKDSQREKMRKLITDISSGNKMFYGSMRNVLAKIK
jgi:tRNA 2-thiocytidine biosynthesis protein TtcA